MKHQFIIDPSDCADLLGTPNLKLVDCRFSLADTAWGHEEYLQNHIPGAVYAHMDQDLSGKIQPGVTGRHPLPNPMDFIQTLQSWGIDNDDHVIIYDQSHGGLAARLWWMLRWMGHGKTSVLDGGWAEWVNLNLPVKADVPVIKASNFTGNPNAEMIADMHEIFARLNDPSYTVVDARVHTRYTGENEPIDPVAGHIPGAVNMPFLGNINDEGRWKSPEELKTKFASIISGSAQRTAVYCGSGVTACHDILALELAGFPGAHLYPGSWSEWITSSENPVAIKAS